jgi:putative PIN family toxin of toxin-antitoxin system
MRAVLDANVLASGFVSMQNPESTPGQIVRLWRAGKFELVVSVHLRAEVVRILQQPYFRRRLSPAQSSRAAALLRYSATQVGITEEVHDNATHHEDDLILATAVSAKVAYLVSGDEKLQKLRMYEEVAIVGPREFLQIVTQGEA